MTIEFAPYTGKLSDDREVQRLELPNTRTSAGPVSLVVTAVGPMSNNCYFLTDGASTLLIDAATDKEHLLAVTEQLAPITDVLTTHSHWDHVDALPKLLAETGARHHASAGDTPDIPADVDVQLEDNDSLELKGATLNELDLTIRTLHGHTKEGAAVIFTPASGPAHIFSGDSLFPGGVGKTDGKESFTQLLDDVEAKLFDQLPDETLVHPGHGDATTLGKERPHLPEWHERGW